MFVFYKEITTTLHPYKPVIWYQYTTMYALQKKKKKIKLTRKNKAVFELWITIPVQNCIQIGIHACKWSRFNFMNEDESLLVIWCIKNIWIICYSKSFSLCLFHFLNMIIDASPIWNWLFLESKVSQSSSLS